VASLCPKSHVARWARDWERAATVFSRQTAQALDEHAHAQDALPLEDKKDVRQRELVLRLLADMVSPESLPQGWTAEWHPAEDAWSVGHGHAVLWGIVMPCCGAGPCKQQMGDGAALLETRC
jgi:hypothetical protein